MRALHVASVVCVVAGCGPGFVERREPAQLLASAAVDPAAMEKLLRGSVVNGGLWFADPDCARQFSAVEEIRPPRLSAFAKCLAGLHLQLSSRTDSMLDAIVMSYAPGIEIEARLVGDREPRLTWIGFESRRDAADGLPTITPETLESLRTAGDRNGPIEPGIIAELSVSKSESVFTWLNVCIGADGAVTRASARETSSLKVGRVLVAAAEAWRFRPFIVGGQAMPVCSMVRIVVRASTTPEVETLPMPSTFAGGDDPSLIPVALRRLVSGNRNVVPDDLTKMAIQNSGVRRITGSFKVCSDVTGNVVAVRTIRSTGWQDYDLKILRETRKYAYEPFIDEGHAVPVCTVITFIYSQTGTIRVERNAY
jgi:hypothetical protein